MKSRARSLLVTLSMLSSASLSQAQNIADLDPHLHATVSAAPAPTITLQWNTSAPAGSYIVRRRDPSITAWMQIAMLPASATTYEDRAVEPGRAYEYVVQRTTAMGQTIAPGYGYVIAGIDVPFRDDPGVVALVVAEQTASGASAEVDQLSADLHADGWTVARVTVPSAATPPMVRAELQSLRRTHGERLVSAILLGAVPRAFSGNIRPDGHADHEGAWPADGYYADLDGDWPDVRDYGGTNFNANRAGDGKFDPSTYPSPLELSIGRIDAERLPLFTDPAVALVRRYLARNHAYRVGEYAPRGRTWVSDSFGYFSGEAFARIAWRDGNALYASDPSSGRPFFDALEDPEGYAFAFGCGGGNPQGAGGVGSTTDFTRRMPRAVFIGLFGSYFGDWSYDNNFLRAPLFSASPALASHWFSRPTAHFHGLGAMRSFGDELLRTIQGSGYDVSNSQRQVHQALMGDPTLRMFTVKPPSMLSASGSNLGVSLAWMASAESDLAGYHVFRVDAAMRDAAAFSRVTTSPVRETTFLDETAMPGVAYEYRVVAVRKFTTGSGTFFNHSLGALATATRPMAPPPLDAGLVDASVLDAPSSDASSADAVAVADASGSDASSADGGNASAPGGCACRTSVPVSPARLNVWAALAAVVALSARRSRSRRARSGA